MLPASYFTAWGPGALYVELYVGMCRALAAPWLSAWVTENRSGTTARPLVENCASMETSAAGSTPAAEVAPQPPSSGACIISFDQARARLAERR